MKVAIVHDFLREYGGAERVLEVIHEMWPKAPLYTSFIDWGNLGNQGYRFKSWDIRTSWVQHVWFIKRFISPLRFLAPAIWGSFDLSGYDVVISSSGWFMCRGAVSCQLTADSKKKPLHICYIHHPPRNLYGYATGSDWQKYWPVRVYGTIINFFLRHYDWETAQRVDYFVANSEETARRVQKFYRRESTVIYPPIEITQGQASAAGATRGQAFFAKRSYFLSVGRLTYSKRVDLAIRATYKLKLPLKIVGSGKDEAYLRSIAGPNVEFLGSVTDDELGRLYAGAKALIFCALDEDFGMVPVEAMARGIPVIGLAQGGVKETVVDGVTGVLFGEPTVESLVAAIGRFGRLGRWGRVGENQCRMQAKKFSKDRFKKELKSFVEKAYQEASPSKNP